MRSTIYPRIYKKHKTKKPVYVALALAFFLYLLHLFNGASQYNQKIIQTQYELSTINQEIQLCEKKLKILRKLRQEKENLLISMTY